MKILYGVFNWGLGHATRSTPVIEELLNRGHHVHIVASDRALAVLTQYFRDRCTYHDVQDLTIPYSKTRTMVWKFITTTPQILADLRRGRKAVEALIQKERFDRVVSDCRYDVYDTPENSFLINHHLSIETVPGAKLVLDQWQAQMIRKYRRVLVPDYEKNGLSGILSHDLRLVPREKLLYIGILSRLRKKKVKKDIDYFVSLSGPEPQRTILEKKLLDELPALPGRIVVAGGNPEEVHEQRGTLEFYSYLDAEQQEDMLNRAKTIITRSGYSTILDLVELENMRALLIPTPGQPEQEYLGKYYDNLGWWPSVSQYDLDLVPDLARLDGYTGYHAPWKTATAARLAADCIEGNS